LTEICSGCEEGSYLRLIYFVSSNSRLDNREEKKALSVSVQGVGSGLSVQSQGFDIWVRGIGFGVHARQLHPEETAILLVDGFALRGLNAGLRLQKKGLLD
jgi:hypothetical protein